MPALLAVPFLTDYRIYLMELFLDGDKSLVDLRDYDFPFHQDGA